MIGSGDSYVSASVVSLLSKGRAMCCYPSTLILDPEILNDRELYVISISGRTTQNIKAAIHAKQNGIKTIAITAEPQSKLARNCDRLIKIKFKGLGVMTSGTLSFLASTLMCLSLITKITTKTVDLRNSYEIASNIIDILLKKIPTAFSSIIFLGDGLFYPVAYYGSLKINEVLGIRSFSYSVEEYCHAPLFSINRDDLVVILNGSDRYSAPLVRKLTEKLDSLNYSSFYLDFPGPSSLDCLFQAIFSVQLLALRLAEKYHMAECSFVQRRDLLGLSSSCIY